MTSFRLVSVNDGNLKEYLNLFHALFPKDSHTTDPAKVTDYERWIVTVDDAAAGICGLYGLKGHAGDKWMDWYGILPEQRGHGLGGAVLDAMIEQAAGARLLLWTTVMELEGTRLEAFYSARGFIKTPWELEYNHSPVFTFHRGEGRDVRTLDPLDWLH